MGWADTSDLVPRGWTCGYCGNRVGGTNGYYRDSFGPHPMSGAFDESMIYICPHCEKPTAFIVSDSGRVDQVPGPMEGSSVQGVPETVSALYDEIRKCAQAGAYTAAVLASRKMLMHLAVERGAEPDKPFASYVGYLADNGWIPPNGREWVDEIRKRSNEQNHEIVLATREDAAELLDFIEMLLRFVYEFPARMRK